MEESVKLNKVQGMEFFKNPDKIPFDFYYKYCHPMLDENGEITVWLKGGIESYHVSNDNLVLTYGKNGENEFYKKFGITCGVPPHNTNINDFCLECLNDRLENNTIAFTFKDGRIRNIDYAMPGQTKAFQYG
ncbi:MAG: hypothetical protein IPO98_16495 [Saprospiraceae bacterium]|nr:hypothetical protein [Saprospiraceae bacterium]